MQQNSLVLHASSGLNEFWGGEGSCEPVARGPESEKTCRMRGEKHTCVPTSRF